MSKPLGRATSPFFRARGLPASPFLKEEDPRIATLMARIATLEQVIVSLQDRITFLESKIADDKK